MAESGDDASKTEEPSSKRLDEARHKGQTVSTRELNHFFMMLALALFLTYLAPRMAMQMVELLSDFITKPDMFEMTSAGVSNILQNVAKGMVLILIPLFLLSVVAAIAPAAAQGKWLFAVEQVLPKFNKVSPFAGFKRIFGLKSLVEFLKNLLKVTVMGVAVVMTVLPYRNELPRLATSNKTEMFSFAQTMAARMLIAACVVLFFLSLIDYVYQRIIFMKSMRMTRQEVKDEHKQQDGDPLIKGKVKQLRRERARRRMMANVPKADVIITNPTHYAVALKYDSATMRVPKVLAKGADEIAARIREVAAKHKIPVVRNPPLARVLYDTTEIDDDIPVDQYQAVAKIIGYVYKLKGKPLQKTVIKRPIRPKKK
jgi:flagellar biosynthetic protein FlhB